MEEAGVKTTRRADRWPFAPRVTPPEIVARLNPR